MPHHQLPLTWILGSGIIDIASKDYAKFYEVFISKENNDYIAKIKTRDSGDRVYRYIQAKINGDNNHIDFIFNDYLPQGNNTTDKPYNAGDNLLGFTKKGTVISTHWGKIVPANNINKADGTYFKIRENGQGYIGHWYDTIPQTGGNSTTIEIKEISDTSVSFHLYYTRSYRYEGTNIKLENNIARFNDEQGYKTSGTVEFCDKSIIVNIEQTEIPILHAGKTVFNYKVDEFTAVSTIPIKGATEVDLEKGIEIDFGRRIYNTTNGIGALLTKPNVPNGPNDGSILMDGEIKGNKLILTLDKLWKPKAVPGQKYELLISEGELRDEAGNINSQLKLEFTAKK